VLRILALALLASCTRADTASRDLGAPCGTDLDCGRRCLPAPSWPGGFCTRPCAADRDCPVGSACADGVCLFSCFDDQDCGFLQPAYGCRDRGGKLVCAPPLPDGGIGAR
jgi:hypothetical protein